MARGSGGSRTIDSATAQAYLPDFCATTSVLIALLVAELVAFILTIAAWTPDTGFLIELSKTSLFIVWTALLGCALLCQLRARLEASGPTRAFVLCYAILLAMTAALDSGRLSADLTNLALYGGEGLGRVVLDGSGQVPALALQFDLFNLDARPFLIDLADFKWIEGRAAMAIDVSTSGASEKALAAGCDDYDTKPIEFKRLLDKIRVLLEEEPPE